MLQGSFKSRLMLKDISDELKTHIRHYKPCHFEEPSLYSNGVRGNFPFLIDFSVKLLSANSIHVDPNERLLNASHLGLYRFPKI